MVRIHDCSFHRSNPRNASLPVLIVYMEEQTEPKTQPRISLHPSSSIQGCHHRQDTIPVKRDMSSRRIGWEGANPLNGGLEMKKALISERQSRSLEGWKNRQTELDLPSARLVFSSLNRCIKHFDAVFLPMPLIPKQHCFLCRYLLL